MPALTAKKRFTANFGFEKMRSDDVIITRTLQMYYAGMSVRDIADCFEQEDITVSYRTIYNWVAKYSKMTSDYSNAHKFLYSQFLGILVP